MASSIHGKVLLLQLSIILFLKAATSIMVAAEKTQELSLAKQGCPNRCGDLIIPYPFGMDEGCFLQVPGQENQYRIKCDKSTKPPTAYGLNSNSIRVTNFIVDEGEFRVPGYVARDCFDINGNRIDRNAPYIQLNPPFTISSTRNKFIAIGCDTYAIFRGFRGDEELVTGCMSICNNPDSIPYKEADSCSGVGCCEAKIPRGMKNRTVRMSSYNQHREIFSFNPCSYAFTVEDGFFTFNSSSFKQFENIKELPMVLNWEIGNETCDVANKTADYQCKENSKCLNRSNFTGTGYYCQCLPGYQGNPYLGCQDIDECAANSKSCVNGKCVNNPGNYSCECDGGFISDGPQKCIPEPRKSNNNALKISLGISISFFVIIIIIFWIYHEDKKKKFKEMKAKYFDANGGPILQQELQVLAASGTTTQIFPVEELERATKNFNDSQKIGEGGYGIVYRGTLDDKREVAIKKSNMTSKGQKDQFVNEVVVLSQISHRNVVRLVGCCAETETPLLVYEFVDNGTLYEHIHKMNGKGPLIFKLRMKIAKEVASALSYLHNDISTQIVHRDVKATNILLDEKFTAKVSDFGASKQVLENQDQLPTAVQGTPGYLDPEYVQSNTFTDKSDVYSFGVVLVELITSQVAMSTSQKLEEERSLANLFLSKMENDQLSEILDDELNKTENMEIIKKVANLAQRCLSAKGAERPTMKAVAEELEEILLKILPKQPPGGNHDSSTKETIKCKGDSSGITKTEYHVSMQNQSQMVKPLDENDGR